MNGVPSGSQTLLEYLLELERRSGQSVSTPLPIASVAELAQGRQPRHGQTLREVLEEAQAQNSTKLVGATPETHQTAQAAGSAHHAARVVSNVAQIPHVVSSRQGNIQARAEGRRESREVQTRTSTVSGRTYRQRIKITVINPISTPGAAVRMYRQKTRITGVNPMDMSGPAARTYRQRTKITGLNPMDLPEAAAGVAQAHARTREVTSALLAGPQRYQQRARGLGATPLTVSMNDASRAKEGEPISSFHRVGLGSAAHRSCGELEDPSQATREDRESVFYMALGEVERARLLDPSNMSEQAVDVRARVDIRTFADILEGAGGSGREGLTRKRAPCSAYNQVAESGADGHRQKRPRLADEEGDGSGVRNVSLENEVAAVMRSLEVEFEEKEKESHEEVWCEPIPHSRKVVTASEFYKAFHEMKTLPIHACTICYRKFSMVELEEFEGTQSTLAELRARYGDRFGCRQCFAPGISAFGCVECIRGLKKRVLSPPGHLHNLLRCEHEYPDELNGLTPVEEKLISINSCYGFITKYSVVKGARENATYPKHVKGHITVFPNHVQELATRVLPHPLLRVLDEIHISWQGAEKPAPKDLSKLLSVRRRIVERALVWLKRNNPHYADIEIDIVEMEKWDAALHGVPSQVYERLERNEPSAWEKTRTAQLVPPTERGRV